MNENKLLKTSLILSKVFLGFCIFFALVMLIGLIVWHVSPESFESAELVRGFKAGYGIGGIEIHLDGEAKAKTGRIFLSDLGYGMIYWLFIRGMTFMILTILGLQRIIDILKSIKDIHAFYDQNISSLKSIGKYALIAAVISFFNFSFLNGSWDFHLTIPFGPLIISFLAYVLAEVFVEGKLLLEDKNMIV